MSDADSDSISNPSNAHISEADGDEASSVSPAVRELCDRLRANDPRVLDSTSFFVPVDYQDEYSEVESIEVFHALKENTRVRNIQLWLRT
jgi:hypothetical protein